MSKYQVSSGPPMRCSEEDGNNLGNIYLFTVMVSNGALWVSFRYILCLCR